jgi:hypothetical protein
MSERSRLATGLRDLSQCIPPRPDGTGLIRDNALRPEENEERWPTNR